MNQLPDRFRKDGFDFTLNRRRGNLAIYEKAKPGHHSPSYEVGIIRNNPARIAFGKDFPASESWPSSEEWGVKAWTCTDLTHALKRFGMLEDAHTSNAGKVKSHKNEH